MQRKGTGEGRVVEVHRLDREREGVDSSQSRTRLHAVVERISSVPILGSERVQPVTRLPRESQGRGRGSGALRPSRTRACTKSIVCFAEVSVRVSRDRERISRATVSP